MWEYIVLMIQDDGSTALDEDNCNKNKINYSNLDLAGRDGWEIVSVTTESEDYYERIYLKRPLTVVPKEPGWGKGKKDKQEWPNANEDDKR